MTYTPSPGEEDPIDYSMKSPIFEVPDAPSNPTLDEATFQEVDTQEESSTEAAGAVTTTEESKEPEQSTDTEEQNKESDLLDEDGFYKPIGAGEYLTGMGYGNKQVRERISAPAVGTADTVSDTVSFLSRGNINIPKFSKYDDQATQAIREIGGFIIPELVGVGWLKRLGTIGHAKLGWGIGNNAWVRRLSMGGIDVGVATGISAVKTETSDPGNFFNFLSAGLNLLPGNWDWVAKDLGTFQGQDPDLIRQRNIQADGIMMGGIPILGGIAQALNRARGATKLSVSTADIALDGLEITGNNARSKAALADINPDVQIKDRTAQEIWENDPDTTIPWRDIPAEDRKELIDFYESNGDMPTRGVDPADKPYEMIVDWALDQDSALDELGRYNVARYGDVDIPMKGVNDLYEFNEIGMRTVDDLGVFGAAIDQARISRNAGTTMGRLRNMLSPAAKKYVVDNLNAADDISLSFAKALDDIDDVSVQGKGWSLSMDDINKAGEDLVVDFFDPTLDINGIRRMLGNSIKKNEDGVEILMPGSYGDVFNQLVKMGKEFNSMTIAKAQAYVGTSLAGQLSDAAEMARLNRDSMIAVEAAQERILDNMKYLMRVKGSTNFYKNQKNSLANLFDTAAAVSKQTPEQMRANYSASMQTLNTEIDQFADELAYSFKRYPELGEAIMELYELTDGRVFSIDTINDTLKKSFGWASPFKSQDPKTPNLIGNAVRANWFNSTLSALGTPVRAFAGNIGGIIDEPLSYFAGALVRGDMKSIQKGMFAYRAFGDIRTKAAPMMRDLFKKASQNVKGIELATDLDYSINIDRKLDSMRALAAAEADRGNTGIQYMINEYITLQEMAQHPALKFSSNLMTGMDGLPQSMIANAEARFRAIEKGAQVGINNPTMLRNIANSEYNKMFEGGALLKDQAAKYGADRIALRANTPLAEGLNEMVRKFPWTRMFFPFPGTQANIFNLIDETIPAPFRSFQRDINELAYTSLDKFQENPQLMRDILERKGYDVNTMDAAAQLQAVIRLKNKTVGRKAISTFVLGSFTTMYFSGRVTGEGIYDRQAQAAREKTAQIPKNSVMGLDGRWYSYMELLGPGYGRWVSTLVTALENANYLGSGNLENIEKKLAVVFGGILEEDSGLSSLTPLMEMLQGNKYSMNRWASGMVNSLGPLGGLRNEMGNLLNGGLRIVDNDIRAMIANRNKALGLAIPDADLPKLTNPLDGTVPNEYNPILRLYNTFSPVKVTSKASENSLFLNDIGYSYTTMFKSYKGVDLLPEEREALFKLVAEDGQFNRDVTRIRKKADRIGYIDALREAKANGASGEELKDYLLIQKEIRDAAKVSEEFAFSRLAYKHLKAIYDRVEDRKLKSTRSQIGAESFIQQVPTR